MLEEIQSFYDSLVSEINILSKEYEDLIEEHDNIYSLLQQKTNSIISEYDNYIDNIDIKNVLKEVEYYALKDVSNKKSASKEYHNYIFSYFESCIVVRNQMITNSNSQMKYSYLFLLTHFFELVLKKVNIHQNESFKSDFNKPFSTHDIINILTSYKEQFINLGLNKNYYDMLLFEFKKISTYCNETNDFQQSFKYPLKKDRITSSITDSLINADIFDLQKLVESHKNILLIGLIIYLLANKENFKYLNKMISDNIGNLKLSQINISSYKMTE